MATEKLNISGWDDGWPTGFVTNVDEPVASADGQSVSTTIRNDSATFDLTNVVDITDAAEVTAVTITVRGRVSSTLVGEPKFSVELFIGGVSQGADPFVADLSTSWVNQTYSWLGWDQDWTQAQLNSAQVKVTAQDALNQTTGWLIDCIDVDITYSAPIETPAGSLALSPKTPSRVPLGDNRVVFPDVGSVALAGKAPIFGRGVGTPVGAAQLQGQVSYVNPLSLQLQVNGSNGGWPTGFFTNIDDTTAVPDGQTISTTIPNDTVLLNLDDVTGVIDENADVARVTGVIRGTSVDTAVPGSSGYVSVQLLVNSVVQITELVLFSDSMQNRPLFSTVHIGEGLTVSQLNSMQVRVQSVGPDTTRTWYIDAIDIVVAYVGQAPIIAEPGAGSLTTSLTTPTLYREYNAAPAAATLALSGKLPTLLRQDTYYPDEKLLVLTGKVPTLRTNYIPLPGDGSLTLAPKANDSLTRHLVSPAVVALTLTGKVPTLDAPANHWRYPARGALQLSPQNVLAQNGVAFAVDPPRVRLTFAGAVPVLAPTGNVIRVPDAGALALTAKLPVASRDLGITPDTYALSLSGKLPASSYGVSPSPGAAAATLTGYVPKLLPEVSPSFSPATYGLRLIVFTGLQLLSHTPKATVAMYRTPATATLVLAGENPAPQTTDTLVISVPRTQLTLAGQAPTPQLARSALPAAIALALSGAAPSMNLLLPPIDAGALQLAGKDVNVGTFNATVTGTGALALATTAPTLSFTTSIGAGEPGLVRLSVDYDIEFIATPTTILLP